MRRPIIGITTNFGTNGAELALAYWQSVRKAGGTPLLLAPTDDEEEMLNQLEQLDGLLLSGGADVNPVLFGEDPLPELHHINPRRDAFELPLTRLAQQRHLPIFGICRGIQVMAAALGGRMSQDIEVWYKGYKADSDEAVAPLIKHSQDAPRDCATHFVEVVEGSLLHSILGKTRLTVNSFHHQAVTEAGPLMKVVASSADGILEAIEGRPEESFLLGVQWHPECMPNEDSDRLFKAFVEAARLYGTALEAHARINTLDSHCDTPMFFNQLIEDVNGEERKALNLTRRNSVVLMDAQKMDEGHLDEVYMVSYIPQGPRDEAGYASAKAQVIETYRRLDVMLEETPELEGRVHRGIENGYAIGKDLSLIQTYKEMGCEYMTLCHNGHNDICDSARPKKDEPAEEHHGLSAFGREVVQEMNRQHMLIDLSHAGEKTFYDVLEASAVPVAVTHACCRALCDHPRNLTDDQLRAIAKKDGVVQCTMYEGFVRLDHPEDFGIAPEENPSLKTFIAHLEHMIEVCGIDHVGIGSDFDGDGGVPGLSDASYCICITEELLKRGYSEDDLCKIWGDNFRRVLYQA